jgi:hypothetical protein
MTSRTSRRAVAAAVLATGLVAPGCVQRRFVIESNVPNAQVYIDNRPVGAAPAHAPFEYYGTYTVTLVHPGYETAVERVRVRAPWYAYPPFDFAAEVLWPFPIRDTRRYYFHLTEATRTRVEDLVSNADALRARGQNLPPPERPAAPRGGTPLPPDPQPLPPPGTLPPEPGPGEAGPPPGVVPGVGPGGP